MKDEIKEIINDLQRVADRKCYPEDILDGSIAQEWVDYITDLQEENEYFSDCDKKLRDKIKNLEYRYKVLKKEYTEKIGGITSRQDIIDKAIEYCKLNKEFTPRLEDVENILNGGDDNE